MVYDNPKTIPGIAKDTIVKIWIILEIFPFLLAVTYAVEYAIIVPIKETLIAINNELNIYFPILLDIT